MVANLNRVRQQAFQIFKVMLNSAYKCQTGFQPFQRIYMYNTHEKIIYSMNVRKVVKVKFNCINQWVKTFFANSYCEKCAIFSRMTNSEFYYIVQFLLNNIITAYDADILNYVG